MPGMSEPREIMLVEDNPADVRLTKEVLKEAGVRDHLNVVWDGEEAMEFLHQEGKYAQAPRPDLILLDLNLPKKDGREVLHEIKTCDALRRIPVLILTTSSDPQDVMKTYNRHANCYITKPVSMEQFFQVAREIKTFWLTIAALPPKR